MSAKEMIQEQKAKAQSVVDGFDAIEAQIDIDLKSEYDRGVADGKASMPQDGQPSDKLYSQVELDGMIQPLQASLVEKEAQITSMQEQVAAIQGSIDSSVEAKIAELKAVLKAEYAAQQVAESTGETGFAKLLD